MTKLGPVSSLMATLPPSRWEHYTIKCMKPAVWLKRNILNLPVCTCVCSFWLLLLKLVQITKGAINMHVVPNSSWFRLYILLCVFLPSVLGHILVRLSSWWFHICTAHTAWAWQTTCRPWTRVLATAKHTQTHTSCQSFRTDILHIAILAESSFSHVFLPPWSGGNMAQQKQD